jgi:hypothetical protein
MSSWIIIALSAVALACLTWVVYAKMHEGVYTREKYAFRCLAASVALAGLAVASISSRKDFADHVVDVIATFTGHPAPQGEPAPMSEQLLICGLVLFAIYMIFKSHREWDGQVSVQEAERRRLQIPESLIRQGISEGIRLVKRTPPPELYRRDHRIAGEVIVPGQPELVWHVHARELFELWYSTSSFSEQREDYWDARSKCWIGRDTRTGESLFLFCFHERPDEDCIASTSCYAENAAKGGRHSIFVVYRGTDAMSRAGGVSLLSEGYLLDNLVDFTDYYNEIRRRVEQQRFPDTGLTIRDIYAPSELENLAGDLVSEDMANYVEQWSNRPPGRQLAILGDYGQGKSTGALMFVYVAITATRARTGGCVPILFELRGKSPANMLPHELLGIWAQQYRLQARSLMKLLIAGRLMLIFEGFDEMANVATVDARLSHFRSLWQLGFPKTKVLFTGRPNFFFEDRELDIVFKTAEGTGTATACEVLRLRPFSLSRITDSLRWTDKSVRDEILAAAQSSDQILEMVARPSLLYYVATLWGELRPVLAAGRLTSAQVIDRFILHSYQRQGAKERELGFMVLTTTERRYFLEGLAVHMGSKETTNQITAHDMRSAVERLYLAYPDESHILDDVVMEGAQSILKRRFIDAETAADAITTDVSTHGILISDFSRSGTFRFAHKSFYEILFAKSLAYNLLQIQPPFYRAIQSAVGGSLKEMSRSDQVVRFFSEVVAASFGNNPSVSEVVTSSLDVVAEFKQRHWPIATVVRSIFITRTKMTFHPFLKYAAPIPLLVTGFAALMSSKGRDFLYHNQLVFLAVYLVLGLLTGGAGVFSRQVRKTLDLSAVAQLWVAILLAFDEMRGAPAAFTQLSRILGARTASALRTAAIDRWYAVYRYTANQDRRSRDA